jgi:hypothetical protein
MLASLTPLLSRMDSDTFNKIEGTTNTVETSHVQRNLSGIKHSLAVAISLFVAFSLLHFFNSALTLPAIGRMRKT